MRYKVSTSLPPSAEELKKDIQKAKIDQQLYYAKLKEKYGFQDYSINTFYGKPIVPKKESTYTVTLGQLKPHDAIEYNDEKLIVKKMQSITRRRGFKKKDYIKIEFFNHKPIFLLPKALVKRYE